LGAALVGLVAVGGCEVPGTGGGAPTTSSTSTTARPQLHHLALGDSFSSGEGAPPYDASSGSCDRSSRAWPRRLAADSRDIARLEHLACAGARTVHLVGPWTSRGLPAQISATPDDTIDLVTLTIGGNDVGFGDIVQACVLDACPSPQDPALVEGLAQLAGALEHDVYPALRRAYPSARLVHVGYPRLTPPSPRRPVGCLWLPPADQAAAIGIVDAIDATIREAAGAAGVDYVDVSAVLAGHELCTSAPWVRPILSQGAVHPTAEGQLAIERAVAAALDLPLR
jgi:hypothetical protein